MHYLCWLVASRRNFAGCPPLAAMSTDSQGWLLSCMHTLQYCQLHAGLVHSTSPTLVYAGMMYSLHLPCKCSQGEAQETFSSPVL